MKNNIINFNKIGFIKEIEFLPNFFDNFDSKEKMRQLFLNLTNCMIPKNCCFSKYEQRTLSKYSLNIAFKHKVETLKPISNIHSFKPKEKLSFKFCMNSTIIINNYEKTSFKNLLLNNSDLLPIASFLNLCFIQNRFELLINKNLLFHEFIIKKLKKIHSDKTIIDGGNSVTIIKNKEVILKIYNSWKNINKNNLNIKEELNYAINDIENKKNNNIYLIYPKNKDFDKHIELKVEGLEKRDYKIKVIPYSLRAILRQTI